MVNITYVQTVEPNEEECSICKDAPSNTKLGCGHSCFCMQCIRMWTKHSATTRTPLESTDTRISCPLCRAHITQIWTSDPGYRVLTDKEELFYTIKHLVCKHVEACNQRKYIHALSCKVRDVLKYMDAGTILRAIDARKGGIERALQCLPLTTLVKMIGTMLTNPISTGDIPPLMYIPAQPDPVYMYIVR